MPEVPKVLEQEFRFENEDFRPRGQSTFSFLAMGRLNAILNAPLGSNGRSALLIDMMDLLRADENPTFQNAITVLSAEQPIWNPAQHGGTSWTVHWQRGCLRAIRQLMRDRDLDGPKDLGDEESQL